MREPRKKLLPFPFTHHGVRLSLPEEHQFRALKKLGGSSCGDLPWERRRIFRVSPHEFGFDILPVN
jgi:hypothetical protein